MRDEVQHRVARRITRNRGVRLIYEIPDSRSEPMIPSRGSVIVTHSLLNNGPLTFSSYEEAVMVDRKAILHSSRVDLGSHATVIRESRSVHSQTRPNRHELVGCPSRRFSFSACDENSDIARAACQSFFKSTTNRRCHSTRVPVESKHASERLKPVRIGEAFENFRSAVLDNHCFDNRGS